jgi:membrane protein implicated in regulation of membrane protease activity
MFWIWMAAAVVFLIIELLAPTFISLCFVAGTAAAGVYSYFRPESHYWQVGIFVVVTVVLLPLSRKLAKKITKPAPRESNVDAMLGKTAIVTAAIDPDHGGKVKFEGEIWQALAHEPIEENAKVKILSVSGTKLHVERFTS